MPFLALADQKVDKHVKRASLLRRQLGEKILALFGNYTGKNKVNEDIEGSVMADGSDDANELFKVKR